MQWQQQEEQGQQSAWQYQWQEEEDAEAIPEAIFWYVGDGEQYHSSQSLGWMDDLSIYPPWKLTWQWKIHRLKMYILLKTVIF